MFSLNYKSIAKLAFVTVGLGISIAAQAQQTFEFSVKVTNITKGISFTPILSATHNHNVRLFDVGEVASPEVIRIAEGGDIAPLQDQLNTNTGVSATAHSEGLLNPGESVELVISSTNAFRNLSLISMALPTNDTLVSLLNARLPHYPGFTLTHYMRAYDGGSEANSELCKDIPGPRCGGEPFSEDDEGEGYIYPSPGIHGEGDLSRAAYHWGERVAKIEITRIQ